MKTPENIKMGLKRCHNTGSCLEDCPYGKLDFPECVIVKCDDALAYIQHLEDKVPRWISVEERLPEVSAESNGYQITDVVLATTVGYICFGHFEIFKYNGSWEFVSVDTDGDFDRSVTITHWMPLPEPPKEE